MMQVPIKREISDERRTEIRQRIAAVIRNGRKAKKLTQAELAELVTASTGYIGQIERGMILPSADMLSDLVNVLELDANTLFYDDYSVPISKEIAIHTKRISEGKQEFVLGVLNLLENLDI